MGTEIEFIRSQCLSLTPRTDRPFGETHLLENAYMIDVRHRQGEVGVGRVTT